jgi:uncharacterized protein (TIGR02145 family)
MDGEDILALWSEVGINASSPAGEKQLRIHPNPVGQEGGSFEFVSDEAGAVSVSLTDASGKMSFTGEFVITPGVQVFRITGISTGVYTLAVTAHKSRYTAKIISENPAHGRVMIEKAGTNDGGKEIHRLKVGKQYIYMYYQDGDQLLLLGHSGSYTTVYPLVPTSNYTVYFNFVPCIDPEGHPYATVAIGSQIWMAQNLNTGVRINASLDQLNNGVREKYCFDDDETNCSIYGGLYQWNEMMQYDTAQGSHGLCPEGWHLPTDGEYSDLMTSLGGDSIAGGKMKETGIAHWAYPNGFASNSSGFTALPGGIRFVNGIFSSLHWFAYFWSSTQQSNMGAAWYRDIPSGWGYVYRDGYSKNWGLSVRCIKD